MFAESGNYTTADPVALYGGSARYTIRRNGDTIGTHAMTFARRADGAVEVTARTEMAVKILVFTAFRFTYDSSAVWRDGRLQEMAVTVDDDGEQKRTDVSRQADGTLLIDGPDGETTAPGDLFPTNHWNIGVVAAEQVLNTITGNINSITVTRGDAARRPAGGGGDRQVWPYQYSGELDVLSWYDSHGRWVGMRFPGRDGSTIDYICDSCGTAP